jgi:hypothetical protein
VGNNCPAMLAMHSMLYRSKQLISADIRYLILGNEAFCMHMVDGGEVNLPNSSLGHERRLAIRGPRLS